jgi:Protein of unknown function (DUF1236)
MKKLLLAAVLTGFAGVALAQTSGSTTSSTTTTTTTISPAWRGEIKEYVVKEKRANIPPPAGYSVTVGAPLPPAVELYSFPTSAPYAKYRYSVIGNETVLVDPTDRKVVEVIR